MVFQPRILRIDEPMDPEGPENSALPAEQIEMRPFREDLNRATLCFEGFIPKEGKGMPVDFMSECRACVYQWLNVLRDLDRSIEEAAGGAICFTDLPNNWGWRTATVQDAVRRHFPHLCELSRQNDLIAPIDTEALQLVIHAIEEALTGTQATPWRPRHAHLNVVSDTRPTMLSVVGSPHD